jgi:hypothetical protein
VQDSVSGVVREMQAGAELWSQMSSNPQDHTSKLRAFRESGRCDGNFSLQNALELACEHHADAGLVEGAACGEVVFGHLADGLGGGEGGDGGGAVVVVLVVVVLVVLAAAALVVVVAEPIKR